MPGGKESLNKALQGLLNKVKAATQSTAGIMSAADKTKLDGIAAGANKYTHPTTSGNKHIPSGGASGQFLKWSADGTAVWAADNNTTYPNFVKSGSGAKAGLVPAPSTTAGTTKYLREDGTWTVPPDNNTTYQAMTGASASAAGKTGLVPAPAAGAATRYLRSDGTWTVPPDTNTTYTLPSFGITVPAAQINAASTDSGWVACTLSSGVSAVVAAGVRRIGNVVFLRGRLTFTPSGDKDAGRIIATVPSGYRPTAQFYYSIQSQAARVAKMYVNAGGQIGIDHILNVETGGVVSTSAWVDLGHVCWTVN